MGGGSTKIGQNFWNEVSKGTAREKNGPRTERGEKKARRGSKRRGKGNKRWGKEGEGGSVK